MMRAWLDDTQPCIIIFRKAIMSSSIVSIVLLATAAD